MAIAVPLRARQILLFINGETDFLDVENIGIFLKDHYHGKAVSFSLITSALETDIRKMQVIRAAMGLEQGIFRFPSLHKPQPTIQMMESAVKDILSNVITGEVLIILVQGVLAHPSKLPLMVTEKSLPGRQDLYLQHKSRFGDVRGKAIPLGDVFEINTLKGSCLKRKIKSLPR